MNKLLINIYVPYLDKKYDIFIPINLVASDAINLIQDTIMELSNGHYVKKDKVILIDSVTGKAINLNNIVKFSGLRNGSNLILI